MEDVTVRLTYTEKEHVKANYHLLFVLPVYRVILILYSLVFLYFLFRGLMGHSAIYPVFAFAFLALISLSLFITPVFAVRRQFKRNPKVSQEVQWTIGEDGVELVTPDITERWKWEEFARISENAGFIFLHLRANRNQVKFLPKRAFTDAAELGRVIEFCRAKLPAWGKK
jgi:hypothetical protein